jgi:hypothetical protein
MRLTFVSAIKVFSFRVVRKVKLLLRILFGKFDMYTYSNLRVGAVWNSNDV